MPQDLNSSLLNDLKILNIPKANVWINEAKFGYKQIQNFCSKIKKEGKVLEIGCGSGILLSLLSEKNKHLFFQGLEPFNDGFYSLEGINSIVKNYGVSIYNISYEEFKTKSRYDLIFCINVFEHLDDWKYLLDKSYKLLKKNGKLIILCPNYGFPFESHFSIPIIINKSITFKLFKNYIKKFEKNNNYIGLWKSLNFVSKSKIKKHLESYEKVNKYKITDDKSIIDFMINRLITDSEFQRRHKIIGKASLLLKKLHLIKIFKFFSNYLPYMKLILKKNY